MKGRVYKIVSPSGKTYVGSTRQTFKQRWRHYFKLSCKEQIILYRSLKKYGPENHIFEELWEGPFEEMFKRESEYGKLFDVLNKTKGLNLALPKTDDKTYSSFSDETRLKMSVTHTGMKHSEETKKKFGKSAIYQSKEFKDKISLIHKGRIVSKETREKLSNRNLKAEHLRKFNILQQVSVFQYDLEGNFIKEWSSMTLANKEIGIDKSQISCCCKGKNKTAGGFKWKYKKEKINETTI